MISSTTYVFADRQSQSLAEQSVSQAAKGNQRAADYYTCELIQHHLDNGHIKPAIRARAESTIRELVKRWEGR
jgi:hypothetical protein